ncbi:MAG TPA: DNA cytosine methyltransferase [Terriglobales bacterium]|nr:DNA cytosine methyltransferase [Terriglobales bacterium]
MRLTHGSLFSGIGGFDLGFERAGIETVWQVEIDPYCRRVLARHFPSAIRYDDVRTVGNHNLAPVDIISGGFPCQDISNAGDRAGIDGEKSGLWREMYRVFCELRPRYIAVENVSALLIRGFERVLGDLASAGYDAQWRSVWAANFGALHRRERVFIVANNAREYVPSWGTDLETDAKQRELRGDTCRIVPSPYWATTECPSWGVADGLPDRVDRLRGLGNAIVPQIAEWIGRRIVEAGA